MDIGTPELSITNNSNTHAVIILQELLNEKGANIYPDGRFAIGTQRALGAFQEENGIEPSGIATEETWKKLRSKAKKKAPAKKETGTKKAPAKKAPAKKTSPKAKKK